MLYANTWTLSVVGRNAALLSDIQWRPSWRLVPSRFPPVGLFNRVARVEDLEIVMDIESLTNDRLREEVGDLSLVPNEDRIVGPGTMPIMAAFTHLNSEGSRFTDGSYGVYYAANTVDAAIAETVFHRGRFLSATRESPIEIDMRSYASDIHTQFHDIRGKQETMPNVYDPDPKCYAAAQSFASSLRKEGSNGIVYDSIRDPGGECIAVFKPRVLAPVVQGKHYCYVWDGRKITDIYVKTEYHR
ncbi:MAG: RES family NAD+ phosphorylase [Gammaproteobacteria bacterium]|nr:RES family NAD+ phosphorylase [Gammaproteobacteria bacterium]